MPSFSLIRSLSLRVGLVGGLDTGSGSGLPPLVGGAGLGADLVMDRAFIVGVKPAENRCACWAGASSTCRVLAGWFSVAAQVT